MRNASNEIFEDFLNARLSIKRREEIRLWWRSVVVVMAIQEKGANIGGCGPRYYRYVICAITRPETKDK